MTSRPLSARRSGRHDNSLAVLRDQNVEVFLLTNRRRKPWMYRKPKPGLLQHQVSDALAPRWPTTRCFLADTCRTASWSPQTFRRPDHSEMPSSERQHGSRQHAPTDFIIEPLPNHLFTRDTSCWVTAASPSTPWPGRPSPRDQPCEGHLPLAPAVSPARTSSSTSVTKTATTTTPPSRGDVLVIGRGAVLIGMSERTTPQGVEHLARGLFKHGQAKQVIAMQLLKHRSCMHLIPS